MERNSIFSVERRVDFAKEFTAFLEDVVNTTVTTKMHGIISVIQYLERCIRYWPYRCGASSIDGYLKAISIDIKNPKCDNDLLQIMELIINLLHWAPHQDFADDKECEFELALRKNNVYIESDRLLNNAAYILEKGCNMMIREIQDGKNVQYIITKRDPDVDAAVSAVPELSDVLLGYLDVRNNDDIDYKESSLIAIYGYMEPKRNHYKGLSCGSISEEFFLAMNQLNIRHKRDSQISIPKRSKRSVYDKLFKMAIYVLQAEKVNQYKAEIKRLRCKEESQTRRIQ